MVRKVVPRRLPLDGHGFETRVVPDERPEVFRVNLIESLQPRGHTLGLATLEALSQAIEQIVIGIKMSARMRARVFLAFARARQ
jgi:hypothetical protein